MAVYCHPVPVRQARIPLGDEVRKFRDQAIEASHSRQVLGLSQFPCASGLRKIDSVNSINLNMLSLLLICYGHLNAVLCWSISQI